MTFLNILKTKKLPQEHKKTKKNKKLKSHVGNSQIKKFRQQAIVRIKKILRMTLLKFSKTKKIHKKQPKAKIFKEIKSNERKSQMKNV